MSSWPFVFAVVPRPTQFFSFFWQPLLCAPFSLFVCVCVCVWERVQNKAKLIMKSQASAGWLACGRAPATLFAHAWVRRRTATEPGRLPAVRRHPAAPLEGCKNVRGRRGRASLCGCGVDGLAWRHVYNLRSVFAFLSLAILFIYLFIVFKENAGNI